MILVGDSITSQTYEQNMLSCVGGSCSTYPPSPNPQSWSVLRYAAGGYSLAFMSEFDPFVIAARNSNSSQVIVLFGGVNDIYSGDSAATTLTHLQTRIAVYRGAGYTQIVVPTVLPFSSAGSPGNAETVRQAYNVLVRAGASASTWKVADIGADVNMGCAGCELNLTYYTSDRVHPNGFGIAYMVPFIAAVVLSF